MLGRINIEKDEMIRAEYIPKNSDSIQRRRRLIEKVLCSVDKNHIAVDISAIVDESTAIVLVFPSSDMSVVEQQCQDAPERESYMHEEKV